MNARELSELPYAPELVVCDVSFISVTKALPPALQLAAQGWEAVVLVKPQFEAGRDEVGKGGVVALARDAHESGATRSPGGPRLGCGGRGRRRLGPARTEGKP